MYMFWRFMAIFLGGVSALAFVYGGNQHNAVQMMHLAALLAIYSEALK